MCEEVGQDKKNSWRRESSVGDHAEPAQRKAGPTAERLAAALCKVDSLVAISHLSCTDTYSAFSFIVAENRQLKCSSWANRRTSRAVAPCMQNL